MPTLDGAGIVHLDCTPKTFVATAIMVFGRCQWCNRLLSIKDKESRFRPTKDHLVPTSRGGRNVVSNLVIACHQCNVQKGSNQQPKGRNRIHGPRWHQAPSYLVQKTGDMVVEACAVWLLDSGQLWKCARITGWKKCLKSARKYLGKKVEARKVIVLPVGTGIRQAIRTRVES
jgi:HNH endonuclease